MPPTAPFDLLRAYRLMCLSRRLDDAQVRLKQQQKTYFQASGAGHEAVLVAAGLALRADDWYFPYYRDQALCLTLGLSPADLLRDAFGSADSPSSAGRQMPGFFGCRRLHIVSQSGPTGMQFLQAVGCAEAGVRASTRGGSREVVYVSSGEGATSEGEFWEAINTAATMRLPVLFLIEDNGWAISVPADAQTPGGSISAILARVPHLHVRECDGTDPVASFVAIRDAAAHCRAGDGPALVHAHVIRAHAHSISDDDRAYRTEEDRQADTARDPIARVRQQLVDEAVAADGDLSRLELEIDGEIAAATADAMRAPAPDPATLPLYVYSPDVDPTSRTFDRPASPDGPPKTMVELINACLRDEMAADDRVLVFGQDVADLTREQHLATLKGKGGVFKATAGLQRRFGSGRVLKKPIA
jgi:2-oxoisovalerate dehydrogenase E1 component